MSAEPTAAEQLRTVFELSDVAMDPGEPFAERLERALETGGDHLGLPAGFLTAIDPAAERQEILVLTGDADGLQEGMVVPLSESYCRKTVASESGTLVVADATAEGWTGDPAYQRFGLESYVRSVLAFDGDRHGTVCLAGDDPCPDSNKETVVDVVELLARWASYELSMRAGRGPAAGNGVVASFADPVDRDTVDATFDPLSNQLRRDLLGRLARSDGPVAVGDLAESLAAGGDGHDESLERVETALRHRHIPKLRHAGVVSFDERDQKLDYRPTGALDRCLAQVGLLGQ